MVTFRIPTGARRPAMRSQTSRIPDDCVSGWALNEADRKLAASTSPSDPNRHRALAAHQSANKNTVENNMRTNYNRATEETKTPGKKNRKPLDVNDLLIEKPDFRGMDLAGISRSDKLLC